MVLRTLFVLLALALSAPSSAVAQDKPAKWADVGGWSIFVDRSVGDGCFATAVYERGTAVRIGFDPQNSKINLFFGHNNWKSLEIGKLYQVRIVFDEVSSYNADMRGRKLGDTVFLAHTNVSVEFVRDFMQRNNMDVYYRGERLMGVSLRQTSAVLTETMNCQRQFGFARKDQGGTQDPFASGAGRDPFR